MAPFIKFADLCVTQNFTKANGDLSCGFLLPQPMFWMAAYRECKIRGTRLPVITSESENQAIRQEMVNCYPPYIPLLPASLLIMGLCPLSSNANRDFSTKEMKI